MADSWWQQRKDLFKLKSHDVGPKPWMSNARCPTQIKKKQTVGKTSHPPTCSYFEGDFACKPWNVRGCSGKCLLNRLPVCDIKMVSGRMCASEKHNRLGCDFARLRVENTQKIVASAMCGDFFFSDLCLGCLVPSAVLDLMGFRPRQRWALPLGLSVLFLCDRTGCRRFDSDKSLE